MGSSLGWIFRLFRVLLLDIHIPVCPVKYIFCYTLPLIFAAPPRAFRWHTRSAHQPMVVGGTSPRCSWGCLQQQDPWTHFWPLVSHRGTGCVASRLEDQLQSDFSFKFWHHLKSFLLLPRTVAIVLKRVNLLLSYLLPRKSSWNLLLPNLRIQYWARDSK